MYSGAFKSPSGPTRSQWQGDEHNEIHLGFSRDGFSLHRPSPLESAGAPVPLAHSGAAPGRGEAPPWRTAFIPQNDYPGAHGFTYGNVQAVAGGFMVLGDRLRFFFSARSGSLGGDVGNLTCVTMVAHLRRDGFAHLGVSAPASGSGWLLTRPLSYLPRRPPWDARGLWLNVNASADGAALRIEVLRGGAVVGRSEAVAGVDSTKLQARWAGDDPMPRLSGGAPFRLRVSFTGGAQLYAFWISSDGCGSSGGAVAAGGPGYAMGADRQCV